MMLWNAWVEFRKIAGGRCFTYISLSSVGNMSPAAGFVVFAGEPLVVREGDGNRPVVAIDAERGQRLPQVDRKIAEEVTGVAIGRDVLLRKRDLPDEHVVGAGIESEASLEEVDVRLRVPLEVGVGALVAHGDEQKA